MLDKILKFPDLFGEFSNSLNVSRFSKWCGNPAEINERLRNVTKVDNIPTKIQNTEEYLSNNDECHRMD